MIRLDEVRTRLEAQVPALAGRLHAAGAFADLVERDAVPQGTPAAFVLLGGIRGGRAQLATGAFIQDFEESVIVVVADRYAGDALGARGVDEITPIVRDVVTAIAGWGPDDAPGVYVLQAAELVGIKRGVLIFQIDFALNDQLRIM
jgi:hypothetical protein